MNKCKRDGCGGDPELLDLKPDTGEAELYYQCEQCHYSPSGVFHSAEEAERVWNEENPQEEEYSGFIKDGPIIEPGDVEVSPSDKAYQLIEFETESIARALKNLYEMDQKTRRRVVEYLTRWENDNTIEK